MVGEFIPEVVVSMLASYLARVYAWRTLMGSEGIVNTLLQSLGLINAPIGWILFSRFPVILAEINLYMPVTALICFASLAGVPGDIREAARDLGAGPVQTLFRVTMPAFYVPALPGPGEQCRAHRLRARRHRASANP